MSGRGGFTLAELLAVLVIAGLAAVVAAPALRPPAEEGAGPAAAALRAVYAEARGAAARAGVPVAVEVDGTGRFRIVAEATDGARDTLREGRLPLGGAAVEGGDARFTPLGRARGAPAVLAGGGVRHEVRLDPWTGWAGDARP